MQKQSSPLVERKLLSDEAILKIKEEFENNPNVIKGSCFDELLDNFDKS